MSKKTHNSLLKTECHHCERCYKRNCTFYFSKADKMKYIPVKKVIPSRKLQPTFSNDVKSCSTGLISNMKKLQISKPRKITKSDLRFDSKRSAIDFCTKCGDSKINKNGSCKSFNSNVIENRCNDIETQVFIDQEIRKKKMCDKNKMLHEYYKNENFKPTVNENQQNNTNLHPIKESTEGHHSNSTKSNLEIYSDSKEEVGFLNLEDDKNIKNLKNFRENNYFECHSAKARISSKGSVTSLTNHECMYRFYLNDRLFPVPLNTDHKKNIRCINCHLPLEIDSNLDESERINGTIQTKVKIGKEIQNLTLLLPIKKTLIIKEKKTSKNDNENNVLYFGIVKLDYNGDSIFNSTLPNDSLALRYQKGYKEFINNVRCHYEKLEEDDVIII